MKKQDAIEMAKCYPLGNFIAMDGNGSWYVYENRPRFDEMNSKWQHEGGFVRFIGKSDEWRSSLALVKKN